MNFRRSVSALAIGLSLAGAASGPVLAQEAAPVTPAETMMPTAADFDPSQLEAFAVAYVEVMTISIQADQQMQAAATEEDRAAVQMQVQEDMVTAVEGIEGISVDEYNAILTASQSDPALAEEVQAQVDAVIMQSN